MIVFWGKGANYVSFEILLIQYHHEKTACDDVAGGCLFGILLGENRGCDALEGGDALPHPA